MTLTSKKMKVKQIEWVNNGFHHFSSEYPGFVMNAARMLSAVDGKQWAFSVYTSENIAHESYHVYESEAKKVAQDWLEKYVMDNFMEATNDRP